MSNLSAQPYKGTRDFYPSDKRIQNYIFSVWHKVSKSFGYEEYGAPILEPLEVYAAKSGQELANEQTYSFIDRGGRTVAIRPEMTPSVSRMVAARRQEMAYPARLYSIANFMRYERPQRGREREFWQLNVDIFGSDNMTAEAEIISMAEAIMDEFGASSNDYVIRINSRKLINFMMSQYFGFEASQAVSMTKLLDRKNKIEQQEFVDQARDIFGEQSDSGLEKLNKIVNAKSMADLPAEILESVSVREIQQLFTLLERSGVKNTIFDITLMRGLDYYTGIVFEVFDTNPENSRSLFGGGRYDGLVGLFGSEPVSAVGFAPGGTTTEDFLRTHNLLPELKSTTDIFIATIGESINANNVVKQLRQAGLNVEIEIDNRKVEKQIKTAVKKEIPYILFIGEAELESGVFTLKEVATTKERKLNIQEIVDLLKSRQ